MARNADATETTPEEDLDALEAEIQEWIKNQGK